MSASAESALETPLSGRVLLGRYRAVRPLARGGMGVVYLGRVEGAAGFSKPVVIKTLLSEHKQGGDGELLFAREARIVSHLQHPGIVAVIDFGKVDAAHVMVLEYVHGYTLSQWFRYVTETRGSVPIEHAVHVIVAVLDALAYAHGLTRPDGAPFGIVHRDISPGNVLIDLQGHVKLTDFGIARTADDEFRTQEGTFRGTLPFMAPEVLQGDPVDGRCDQYACAVLLYLLLTGTHPFKSAEMAQTITRILGHTPPPASAVRAAVPTEFDRAIEKAMSKLPSKRYSSAAEFAEALRGASSWSEREAAQSFAAQVEHDFPGDMPERLGLEPLTLRDASWREAQDTPERARVALSSSPPELHSAITTQERGISSQPATVAMPRVPVEASPTPKAANAWALVGLAAIAAVAAIAALLSVLLRAGDSGPERLLVVEKQVDTAGAEVVTNTSTRPAEAIPLADPTLSAAGKGLAAPKALASTAASTPGSHATSTNPEASRGAPLARAFQRQEGAIQRCFQQSSESLADLPRLAVKFNLDRSGHVVSAFLEPAGVSAQPLGRCILSVARATEFGAQPDAVSFSIPIAARIVRH